MIYMFWKIKTNYQTVTDKMGKNHSDVQEFNQYKTGEALELVGLLLTIVILCVIITIIKIYYDLSLIRGLRI